MHRVLYPLPRLDLSAKNIYMKQVTYLVTTPDSRKKFKKHHEHWTFILLQQEVILYCFTNSSWQLMELEHHLLKQDTTASSVEQNGYLVTIRKWKSI